MPNTPELNEWLASEVRPVRSEQPRYITGLDLGQVSDYSALAVLEQTFIETAPRHKIDITDLEEKERWRARPARKGFYRLRHLKRFDTNTNYNDIVDYCVEIFEYPPLRGSILVPDGTGVGRAVVNMFGKARDQGVLLPNRTVREKLKAQIRPVTITAGAGWTEDGAGWKVAKKELASTVQMLIQSKRIETGLRDEEGKIKPVVQLLAKELGNFKVKVTTAANETYEAWREQDHDDLVLALALSVWVAETGTQQFWMK